MQALKSVKGILNKLTPEKFDRLLGQLVANVTSVDVLNGLIKLVFENAVSSACPQTVCMAVLLTKTSRNWPLQPCEHHRGACQGLLS